MRSGTSSRLVGLDASHHGHGWTQRAPGGPQSRGRMIQIRSDVCFQSDNRPTDASLKYASAHASRSSPCAAGERIGVAEIRCSSVTASRAGRFPRGSGVRPQTRSCGSVQRPTLQIACCSMPPRPPARTSPAMAEKAASGLTHGVPGPRRSTPSRNPQNSPCDSPRGSWRTDNELVPTGRDHTSEARPDQDRSR
jgi:hypothetical protein